MTERNRGRHLQTTSLVAAGAGLAGCTDAASAAGTLATRVRDQPGDIADLTPGRRGVTGRYLLQPVARGTRIEYANVDDSNADDSGEDDD